MSRIRCKDTSPEIAVRSLLHLHGYRFRVHRRDLPGTPDIVLPKYGAAIFIQGCFWHRHRGCRYAYTPKSNRAFWLAKFQKNVDRDARNEMRLRVEGWSVLYVWECETHDLARLARRLTRLLKPRGIRGRVTRS